MRLVHSWIVLVQVARRVRAKLRSIERKRSNSQTSKDTAPPGFEKGKRSEWARLEPSASLKEEGKIWDGFYGRVFVFFAFVLERNLSRRRVPPDFQRSLFGSLC
jgi:hypothetical protein